MRATRAGADETVAQEISFLKKVAFEMLIKLLALGPKQYLADAWNRFDGAVLLLGLAGGQRAEGRDGHAAGGKEPNRAACRRSVARRGVVDRQIQPKPAQAAEGDHLDGIGPPPVPYMKKQASWAGGKASFLWEAIEE